MKTAAPTRSLSQIRRRVRRMWSWLGVLAIATGAGAWHLVCFGPAVERIDKLADSLAEEYAYLDRETQLIKRLRSAAGDNDAYSTELKRLQARSTSPPDEVAFLAWMGARAAESSISLTNYRPDGQVRHGSFSGRSLQISGSGGYEAICRLLFAIRDRSQMTRLASITIRPEDESRTRYNFVLQIELLHGATKTEPQGGNHA